MPQPTDYRFSERLRVRWAEIDAQQIVFNGHYLMYLDTAVAGYWRALAAPYAETMRAFGGDLYVKKATLEYHASARYDEVLEIGLRCARVGRSSIVFQGTIFKREQALVDGELVYVYADPAAQRSQPVPDVLRDAFTAFEAGEPMVDVRVGPWDALGEEAQRLRLRVFVDEQKVPLELELDAADPRHLHAVAFNRFGLAVATGRLVQEAPGVARIGRMATLASMRGGRVGRAVLDRLIDEARRRGDRQVTLSAQTSARSFYARAGFEAQGAPFDDAGIEHIEMVRSLP